MKTPIDPPRLLELAAGTDPELREALRQLSLDGPSAADAAALAENVSRALGHAAPLGASPGALAHAAWLKPLAVVALGVAGSATLWWAGRGLQTSDSPTIARPEQGAVYAEPQAAAPATEPVGARQAGASRTPEPTVEPRAPAEAVAPAIDMTESVAAPSVEAAPEHRVHTQDEERAPSTRTGARTARTLAAAVPSSDARVHDVESALDLIARAQRELATQPARALALLQQHRVRYPRGGLAEERDVLTLDAMSRLGMQQELSQAVREFTRRYPRSMHRERVERILQRVPKPVH